MVSQTTEEKIRQRRTQMLVHSYVYYMLGENLVSDDQWQFWADELTELQATSPSNINWYDEAFEDWDGTTGYHLPQDAWVSEKAARLLQYRDKGLSMEISESEKMC